MAIQQNAQNVKVMAAIGALLKAGKQQDAARVLIRDLRRFPVSRKVDLAQRLVHSLGKQPTAKLIHALAHYPCFYCRHGLEECGLCETQRRSTGARSCCEHCLDLLRVRCDFCDGSGWITYNVIPQQLWPAVILVRSQTALKELSKLLAKPLSDARSKEPRAAREHLEHELLNLNRLAGVFENATDAALKGAKDSPRFEPLAARIVRQCAGAWKKIGLRMRKVLLMLAETVTREAGRAESEKARAIMLERARFYEALAESGRFAGTSLNHPFIHAGS